MSKRQRPGKRDRMKAKALAQSSTLCMSVKADYGKSCCDLDKADVRVSMSQRSWEYSGRNASRIHRAKS